MAEPQDFNQPLLTIDTLKTKRKFITVDGESYFFAVPEADFGADEIAELESYRDRYLELEAGSPSGSDYIRLLDGVSGRLLKIILLDLPDEVLAKIGRDDRLKITQVFTSVVGPTATNVPSPNRQMRRAAQPIGARSSRASKSSTAATPNGGIT